jgi:hypothetical protein
MQAVCVMHAFVSDFRFVSLEFMTVERRNRRTAHTCRKEMSPSRTLRTRAHAAHPRSGTCTSRLAQLYSQLHWCCHHGCVARRWRRARWRRDGVVVRQFRCALRCSPRRRRRRWRITARWACLPLLHTVVGASLMPKRGGPRRGKKRCVVRPVRDCVCCVVALVRRLPGCCTATGSRAFVTPPPFRR